MLLKNVILIRKAKIVLVRTKLMPWAMSWKKEAPSARLMGGSLRVAIMTAIIRNPRKGAKKPGATPNRVPMMTPPMAGPITRVPCHTIELRATAFSISSRSMRWGKRD